MPQCTPRCFITPVLARGIDCGIQRPVRTRSMSGGGCCTRSFRGVRSRCPFPQCRWNVLSLVVAISSPKMIQKADTMSALRCSAYRVPHAERNAQSIRQYTDSVSKGSQQLQSGQPCHHLSLDVNNLIWTEPHRQPQKLLR